MHPSEGNQRALSSAEKRSNSEVDVQPHDRLAGDGGDDLDILVQVQDRPSSPLGCGSDEPVSYTHLDVYKRQVV